VELLVGRFNESATNQANAFRFIFMEPEFLKFNNIPQSSLQFSKETLSKESLTDSIFLLFLSSLFTTFNLTPNSLVSESLFNINLPLIISNLISFHSTSSFIGNLVCSSI
jgi:hypothetical protein